MDDPVLVEIAGGVAEVVLNRPAKRNAWTMAVFDGIANAAASLAGRKDLRAVILRGAGGCFSSGIDLSVLHEQAGHLAAVKAEMLNPPPGRAANRFQQPVTAWATLPVPVIAAIEGVAFGAGMQLALGADFRIVAPDARLSIMEARWGIVPDMGISQSLPRLLRADLAKELIMTGRILGADESLALGLVTRIADDPVTAARAMAADLATRSPGALAASKVLVEEGWSLSAGEGLALEARLQAGLLGGAHHMEMVMAGMQKRPPKLD